MQSPQGTAEKKALDSVSDTELLSALLRHSPDRIYFKDLQSHFIAVSQGLVRHFGLDNPAALIGKTDFDFFGPQHAGEAFADEMRIVQTGQAIIGKIEREDLPDGRIRWATTTKLPLRDHDGKIIGTFGISRDFTAEKELEDRLAAERNLLRKVIDHIPDPIYVKNRFGRYQLDNQAHREFLGCHDEEEVINRTAYDFFPKKQARKFEADDATTLDSGKPLLNRLEVASTGIDGSKTWLLTTKVPVPGSKLEEDWLVCIGRNITEQKLAEEQLRHSNSELIVALHKLKKAHADLREIQLQLIEAEKLKSVGRLSAGVAHEVKNPLAVLRLGLGLLKQNISPDDEESAVVLEEMANAIDRADTVVRGLLDFSAPNTLLQESADFNQIVRNALQFVRGELKAHSVRVETELSEGVAQVKMDSQKMGQVLINLFTNAAHAMGDKGGVLTVRTRREQLTGVGSNVSDARSEHFRIGDWLFIAEILDTGSGIPADKIDQVFQPFFTTKATGSGTGLGLSVCKTIIDLHGGVIEVRNRKSGGTCVTICLREGCIHL